MNPINSPFHRLVEPVVRPAAAALALSVGLAVIGCQNDRNDDDVASTYRDDNRPLAGDTNVGDAVRVNQLETAGVPVEVRPRILNDLGGATIASARSTPTEGGLVYRVTYYKGDGTLEEAMYSSTGQRVIVPPAPTNDAATAGGAAGDTSGGAGQGTTPGSALPPSTRPAGGGQ